MNPLENLKNITKAMPNPVELAQTAKTTQQVMTKQLEQIYKQTQIMEVWADAAIRQAKALEKIASQLEKK